MARGFRPTRILKILDKPHCAYRSVKQLRRVAPMNLLFNVIYAAHANGTHHKLALDALRDLECDNAAAWQNCFLKNVEAYIEGSKAPDKEFKDFKNHVLHVRDNYWGGAPEKAESWYALLVRALREQNFAEAAWCAGVLSHYYTDPIHPFHTAQSEAESNIHRAVEWSISKSYNELRPLGLSQSIPDVRPGDAETWIKDMVIAGAEYANREYETIIARYNFDLGVVDPPTGLDDVSRNIIGRLIVYASSGFASILDRAISEAAIAPPQVSLALDTVLATLKIPVKWVTRKMADAKEARLVEAMYDELQQTGKVEATLSEDDRTVRDLYAREVLSGRESERKAARDLRRRSSPLPQGNVAQAVIEAARALPSFQQHPAQPPVKDARPKHSATQDQPAADRPRQSAPAPITSVPVTAPPPASQARNAAQQQLRIYLNAADEIEAAPSVGPKTARRLERVGIHTVDDLLKANVEDVADQINTRHITPTVLSDWQDQARLVMEVPGLRGTHAQLFVGAGFRTTEDIALADPADVMTSMLSFAQTREGQRLLRDGTAPDLERITNWIKSAEQVLAA